MELKRKLQEAIEYVQKEAIPETALGMILGTGFGKIVQELKIEKKIAYDQIPHFPKPTVMSHEGYLLYGMLFNVPILVFQGRLHRYEGYSYFEITLLVRLFKALGGSTLLLSNAAGAVNLTFKKGDLMVIKDHINLQRGSPLAEKGIAEMGARFVDMRLPYDTEICKLLLAQAKKQKIVIREGVYAAVVGPQLETAAEYRYLKIIGADAVGMSTVPEVIVARQLQLRILAVAVITDICDPNDLAPIDIPDILASVEKGEKQWLKLLKRIVAHLQ